jgi:transposase
MAPTTFPATQVQLTRVRGHIILCVQGVANVQSQTAVPGGVQTADGRAGESRAHTGEFSREFNVTAQSITNWVGQAAGKPLPGKEGLSTAEREELSRLRRQVRQLQQEHDILAKATAWFAGRSDATSAKSSDS